VKLSEIVENKDSKRIPVKASDREKMSGKYPYYGASGIVDHVDDYLFEGPNLLIGEDGANLLSRSTDIAFIADGKYWVNNHAHVLGADHIETLQFLKYFINSIDLSPYVTGSAQPKLNQRNLNKIEVPLLNLTEQKAIVAKLDRAQRLIDIDREMLAKYDKLIQSVFLEMFGDPKSNSKKIKTGKLGDYAFINMGQSPKGSSYNEEGKGEPLLNGPTEFGEKYPQEKQWTTEPKKFAEIDDILFCVRGATAGRTNLADKKYCIGRGLAAIRGEGKLDTTFIHFVLKSHYDYFQNQGQGSTFINIAKKDLSNLDVPIPTKELQDEFVSASKQIENQKQVTKGSLKKSEELFSSLVQGVFG
jgi:type I restriction enzyme, S subunit